MTKRKSGKDFILPQPKRIRLEVGSRKNSVTILQKHENPKESRMLTLNSKTKDSINVKKIPNSADKFNEEHQERYNAREKQSRDRIREVHEHNSTYPNLRNELEKRRSISRPTALNINKSKRNQNTAYNQRHIRKHRNGLSQRLLRKPINSRRRCEPVKNRRKRSDGTSCEVCGFLNEIGKMYDIYALTAEMEMASGVKRLQLYEKLSKISQVTDESKCLASSNHSVSSYHSFGSMGEQPMV